MNEQSLQELELNQEYVDNSELEFSEEEILQTQHRKDISKLLERKLEERKLRADFDELDGEFDWEDYN